MESPVLITVLLVTTLVLRSDAFNKRQCMKNPSICPQSCIITIGGCTSCSMTCRQIIGKPLFNQQPVNGVQGGAQLMSGPGGFQVGGVLPFNPASINFGNLANQGGTGLQGFNPSNIGPQNPSFNTGSNPGSPSGYSNVGNMGPLSGASSNPAVPVGALGGQGINLFPANFGGSNVQPGQQMGGQLVTQQPVIPSTTVLATTTNAKQTRTKVPPPTTAAVASTTAAPATTNQQHTTCAPLRCVAPCDKGITINKQGCPVCRSMRLYE